MANKIQIKQIREAVRENRGFRIKSYLGIVPTARDYRMTAEAAKYWYSEASLPREQQIRYLVSKGNLATLKATSGNDFYNALYYLRAAYQDAVEEVERIARKNLAWQELSEEERRDIRLEAYARNSDESRDEDECLKGQQKIVRRSNSLDSGSQSPDYDFGLLRRIRSGLKYWAKKTNQENTKTPAVSLETNLNYLNHLNKILGGENETRNN